MMSPHSRLRARIWTEENGCPVLYELPVPSSWDDLAQDAVDLHEQVKRDGLSLPRIRTRLRGWMREEPTVEKVAVTYGYGHYTLGIQANPLNRTIMTCLQTSVEKVLDVFGGLDPMTWVVGLRQHQSLLMHSPWCTVERNGIH